MNDLLKVNDLCFNWGTNEILRDVNFDIQPNEIVAILGVNGAGKSTLIKCINRILKVKSGTVEINSVNTLSMNLIDLAKSVSYVPQMVRSNFSMDVFDVVLLGRRPHISWRVNEQDQTIVSETLRFLALEDFAFRRFDKLSGGERQRVLIAKAIAQGSELMLMDEPTSDLDLKNQINTMKKLVELVSPKKGNRSALIAIHDINIAARFADRILLMHEGSIVSSGSPVEVLTSENIATVFGVTSEIIPPFEGKPMRIVIRDEVMVKSTPEEASMRIVIEDEHFE